MQYLTKPQQNLERDIRQTGEQLDEEIRLCPTTADSTQRQVYNATCVDVAEKRARQKRIAIVENYLSNVHQVWPEYLKDVHGILDSSRHGMWQVVLRLAVDGAAITEMAAGFAR